MKHKKALLLSSLLACAIGSSAYETPTMGWSSWNTYRVNISEDLIKRQADAMASKGLKEVGYKYINIDDGYFGGRDSQGNLIIHATRFPNGLKPVVDHIHNLGFKAGIYSDAGKNTCGSFWDKDKAGIGVGMYGHDQQDADFFFKEMGFDFIKVDFCGGDPAQNADGLDLNERERYTAIYNAIQNTGRTDVRMNVCRWAFPGAWVHDVSTSWRISPDINASWGAVKRIVETNLYLSAYATEGKFNDMDMMEVGRGLTEEEDKTHFGMWCIMSSPLLIGCDMTTISDQALSLIKNEELIALNQDPLALQAYVVDKQNGAYILVKDVEEMYGKKRAFAAYNPTDAPVTVTVDMKKLSLSGRIKVRDLYERTDKEDITNGTMTIELPAHGTRIYKLEAEKRLEQSVYEAENAWLEKYSAVDGGDFARVQSGNYSGGGKVSYLGGTEFENNFMEWRNVYSKDGGYYTLSIAYYSGANRSITCTINGSDTLQIDNMNSGDWNQLGTKTILVKLNPGENVIRFANTSDWAPDIDYIQLNKSNEAASPVTYYQPTERVATPESGKTYMIYSAATDAITGEGDRFGFLYASGGKMKRETSGSAIADVKIAESNGPLFTLNGTLTDGFTFQTTTGSYVEGTNVGTNATVWNLQEGPSYRENFPEDSWAISSGGQYWNGNRNKDGDNTAFTTWTDGHPFQFYAYQEIIEQPQEIDPVYGQLKDALNGGNGVGYPNMEAKRALEARLAEAMGTNDDLEILRSALSEYITNTDQIVLPEGGKTYILKNTQGGYLKNEGNALTLHQEDLEAAYTILWNCQTNGSSYNFNNVATNNWLGLASVQSAPVNFEINAAQRVNFGSLPLKQSAADNYLFAAADGTVTTATEAADNETGSSDWKWIEVSQSTLTHEYLAAGLKYCAWIPEGIKAYTAQVNQTDGNVELIPYTQKTMNAQYPLIFAADTETDLYFIPSGTQAESVSQDLKITPEAIEKPADQNAYVFSVKNNIPGFYPLAAGEKIPAYVPYILTQGADTHTYYTINEKSATSIQNVETQKKGTSEIFDLSGRKIQKTTKGIYIIDGKKQAVR